ncbi:type II toxin-antitoxin system PemK/MazF family toxin [Dermabacter hominis]|uniref:type II toxin-antitoxin system PemK/MazF family toxin n=1 Tax=Dermabacter hominis TaxID=36740 RepID=UPI002432FFCE|nr:type II toxin-antitoxin system PemK/MazF family toxin [Dermabacter hominis]
MSLFSSLRSIAGSLARNRRVQRAAGRLAREGMRALENKRKRADTGPASVGPKTPADPGPSDAPTALPDRSSSAPLTITYAPAADGNPDPGEVVWAWVPFEEDPSKGKDRPVLVLAEEGNGVIVALMLTSRDRGKGDHTDEYGNRWVDIGTGSWDAKHRPSEVRVDRLIRLEASKVRREGGKLDKARFDRVANATREEHGW